MPDIFANPSASDVNRVKVTPELIRIRDLPVRTEDTGLAERMTEVLKTPGGTMTLRPIQALALCEIGIVGGLFGMLRVGAGKTLISLLAPVVGFAKRPLLIVPAKLLSKTNRDWGQLQCHWLMNSYLRIVSYEWLGRVQAAEMLNQYEPDLIVADECHKLKNKRAAVTRRVSRYMRARPQTRFVAMSGTVTKRSLYDYAHILRWCLPDPDMPIPKGMNELELWADALDERKGQTKRADPGALVVLCNEEERDLWQQDSHKAARLAFRRRMTSTPGVVATQESPIDASLEVRMVEPTFPESLAEAFKRLRYRWETPDGWPIADGLSMFRHARELALGFFYRWNPRPPDEWLDPRREWCAYVRKVLNHSRSLDSELQVRNAVAKAQEGEGWDLLQAWQDVKDTFEPNTEAVWLTEDVLQFCSAWMKKNKGIVWVEHTCFGDRLSEISGVSYYAKKGLDRSRRAIEDHPAREALIASVESNAEGRNLQGWSKNLITSCPPNGLQCEQLMGRTHRDGQEADSVSFDVIVTCAEHVGAFWQAVRDCTYVQDVSGSPQKLLVATLDVLTAQDIAFRAMNGEARWDKQLQT